MTPEQACNRLQELQRQLQAEAASSAAARATVELDQASVGRLSRMDALQQQQMALAEQRRRERTLKRIGAALRRLESGDYGLCVDCDEPIADARLTLDPATALCLDCARARERGD